MRSSHVNLFLAIGVLCTLLVCAQAQQSWPRGGGSCTTNAQCHQPGGNCVNGACVCNIQYQGPRCDACSPNYDNRGFPLCGQAASGFPTLITNPAACNAAVQCSGNGLCLSDGSCLCLTGTGPNCLVCSGNGSYDAVQNKCVCNANYYGANCDKFCDAAVTCSGNGTCDPTTGACVCSARATGAACDQCAPVSWDAGSCQNLTTPGVLRGGQVQSTGDAWVGANLTVVASATVGSLTSNNAVAGESANFTADVTVGGNVSAESVSTTNDITTTTGSFVGAAAQVSGVVSGASFVATTGGLTATDGTVSAKSLSSSEDSTIGGKLTVTSSVTGGSVIANGILRGNIGNITTSLNVGTALAAETVTATGDVSSSSGNLTAPSGGVSVANDVVAGQSITATAGDITASAGNVTAGAAVSGDSLNATTSLQVGASAVLADSTGNVTATGAVAAADVTASRLVSTRLLATVTRIVTADCTGVSSVALDASLFVITGTSCAAGSSVIDLVDEIIGTPPVDGYRLRIVNGMDPVTGVAVTITYNGSPIVGATDFVLNNLSDVEFVFVSGFFVQISFPAVVPSPP